MIPIKALVLGVLPLFVSMGSALPTNAGVTPAPVTIFERQDRYDMKCNEFHLPINEIDACAMNWLAKGELWVSANVPNVNVHLCDMGIVRVSARAWGNEFASAQAITIGNSIKWILHVCGPKGGSMSANGVKGRESFIVHVADTYV